MQDSPTREKAGRPAGACATHAAGEHYRRFLNYWKDGDIDRDKVAEAMKKITS